TISVSTLPPTPVTYTLSLHDALPISEVPDDDEAARALLELRVVALVDLQLVRRVGGGRRGRARAASDEREYEGQRERDESQDGRSEEHTSELQSRFDLVCRLLLEKKK